MKLIFVIGIFLALVFVTTVESSRLRVLSKPLVPHTRTVQNDVRLSIQPAPHAKNVQKGLNTLPNDARQKVRIANGDVAGLDKVESVRDSEREVGTSEPETNVGEVGRNRDRRKEVNTLEPVEPKTDGSGNEKKVVREPMDSSENNNVLDSDNQEDSGNKRTSKRRRRSVDDSDNQQDLENKRRSKRRRKRKGRSVKKGVQGPVRISVNNRAVGSDNRQDSEVDNNDAAADTGEAGKKEPAPLPIVNKRRSKREKKRKRRKELPMETNEEDAAGATGGETGATGGETGATGDTTGILSHETGATGDATGPTGDATEIVGHDDAQTGAETGVNEDSDAGKSKEFMDIKHEEQIKHMKEPQVGRSKAKDDDDNEAEDDQ